MVRRIGVAKTGRVKRAVAVLTVLLTTGLCLEESHAVLSAKGIVEKAEMTVRGDSMIAIIEITIQTRRWKRTLKVKTWDNRLARKSFAEILAPKADAGNRFLMISKEGLMWQYNVTLGREIKIHPSMMLQSWMGSDFTNDDIVKESSMLDDYTHVLTGVKTVEGQECHEIIMTPKPKAGVVWGKIVYYARTADCLPVRQAYYDQHGRLKRIMASGRYRDMNGRVIPTLYKMVTIKRRNDESKGSGAEEYTLMEVRNAVFNVPIEPGIFTLRNLKRR